MWPVLKKQMPEQKNIIIDLRAVTFIDQDGIEACEEIVDLLRSEKKMYRSSVPMH